MVQDEYNSETVELIMHQTRKPDWCAADLNALIVACRVAARRVEEMARRFGDDLYVSATEELLARNGRAMKALIAQSIGEEPVSFAGYTCDDGMGFGPYKIKCTMWPDAPASYSTSTAPTRRARRRSTSFSMRTCSRCSSAST